VRRRAAETGAKAEMSVRREGLGPNTESLVHSRLPASLAATLRDSARWRALPNLPESEYGVGRLDLESSMMRRSTLDA